MKKSSKAQRFLDELNETPDAVKASFLHIWTACDGLLARHSTPLFAGCCFRAEDMQPPAVYCYGNN